MIPAKDFYDSIAALLSAYANIGVDCKVHPIIAPFIPSTNLVIGDITLGTGDLAGIAVGDAPTVGLDPITGQWVIICPEGLGGFIWIPMGVTPTLPITIYGYAMTNNAGTILAATWAYDLPVLVTVPGSALQFHGSQFLLVTNPLI